MEIRSNVKFSEVMTRTNLEKFYHNLNEKLIPTTNSLEDSAWEFLLSKNYEVGYMSSGIIPAEVVDSSQGHLSGTRHSTASLVYLLFGLQRSYLYVITVFTEAQF